MRQDEPPPNHATMADYVDIATHKSCFCVLPEFALFDIARMPDGGMSKEEALNLGTYHIQELLRPLYARLNSLQLDTSDRRQLVARQWLDSVRWVGASNGRPDETYRNHLPGGTSKSPATGYERFLLDQRRVFLALSRLGEIATVLVQLGERALFDDVVRSVVAYTRKLDDECGFRLEPLRKQLVANVDAMLAPWRGGRPIAFEDPTSLEEWIQQEPVGADHLGLGEHADVDAVWRRLSDQLRYEQEMAATNCGEKKFGLSS